MIKIKWLLARKPGQARVTKQTQPCQKGINGLQDIEMIRGLLTVPKRHGPFRPGGADRGKVKPRGGPHAVWPFSGGGSLPK